MRTNDAVRHNAKMTLASAASSIIMPPLPKQTYQVSAPRMFEEEEKEEKQDDELPPRSRTAMVNGSLHWCRLLFALILALS